MIAPELLMSLVGFDVPEMEVICGMKKRSGYYRIKTGDVKAFYGVDGRLKVSPLEVLRVSREMAAK